MSLNHSLPGVSTHMQPRAAVSAAQHKIIIYLKHCEIFLWLCVAMCLMCGPRQLFFQCVAEMPKGWTPLLDFLIRFATFQ